jgi:hypothetical protein
VIEDETENIFGFKHKYQFRKGYEVKGDKRRTTTVRQQTGES